MYLSFKDCFPATDVLVFIFKIEVFLIRKRNFGYLTVIYKKSNVTGIYKMALEDDKLGLTKEVIATRALPFLFPLSIENGLTVKQYTVIMALIRNMMDRVEQEHSAKLAQLNSLQDEQRSALKVSMSESVTAVGGSRLVPETSTSVNATDQMFSGLGLGDYMAKQDTGAIATGLMDAKGRSQSPSSASASSSASTLPSVQQGLSLEDKRRAMQQTDAVKRMTPGLMAPGSSAQQQQPKGPVSKDLTQSLMERNLSQMKPPASSSSQPSTIASSTSWGGFASSSTPSFASPLQGGPMQQQQPRPDLSAFDSLLSMPSRQPAQPMGAGITSSAQPRMTTMTPTTTGMMTSNQQQQQQQVKPLSQHDINDLLG